MIKKFFLCHVTINLFKSRHHLSLGKNIIYSLKTIKSLLKKEIFFFLNFFIIFIFLNRHLLINNFFYRYNL